MGKKLFIYIFLLFSVLQIAHFAKAQEKTANSKGYKQQAFQFYNKELYDKAASLFEKAALARKEENPVDEKYAELLLYSAVSYDRAGDFENAQKNYLSSFFIYKNLNDDQNKMYPVVCYNLAVLYHTFANFSKAEYFYIRAKYSNLTIYGKENASYATSCYNLARLYYDFGNYTRAKALYIEAKDIRQKVLGKTSYDYAESCGALAKLYDDFGKYTEAESLYRQENYFLSETLGKKHPAYAANCYKLAKFYNKLGKYQKAKAFFYEAKIIYEKNPDGKKLNNALNYNNLAGIYLYYEDYQKSETFYNKSKQIREHILGTQHPDYAETCYDLSNLYLLSENFDKAEIYCREAKSIYARRYGQKHLEYVRTCVLLGRIIFKKAASEKSIDLRLAQYQKAEQLYKEAIGIYKNQFGQQQLYYALLTEYTAQLKLATAKLPGTYLEKKRKYKLALPFYKEVQTTRKNILGNINPLYQDISMQLADLYTLMEQYGKAEALYLKSNRILANISGKKHAAYIASCKKLAHFYIVKENMQKAELFYIKAKNVSKQLYGKENILYTQACSELAGFYQSINAYDKSEALFMEAKTIDENFRGNNNTRYAENCTKLAGLYLDMRKYEEAKTLYFRAKTAWQRTKGKQSAGYAQACSNLATLYLVLADYQKSEQLYTEAQQIIKTSLGKYNKAYADANKNLAFLYKKIGTLAEESKSKKQFYEKALPFYIEAKHIDKQVFGDFHPAYAKSCTNLAELYLLIAKITASSSIQDRLYLQAGQQFMAAKDASGKAKGVHHPDYAETCAKLADYYVMMASFEEKPEKSMAGYRKASPLYHNSLNIYARFPDKVYPFYVEVFEKSAKLSLAMREIQQAEIEYFELKKIYERIFGEEHILYAKSCINLAAVYQNEAKFVEAEQLYIKGNTILNSLLRENSLFMDEKERKKLIEDTAESFDLIHSFILTKQKRNGKLVDLVYNNKLLEKLGLPRPYLQLKSMVEQTKDTSFIKVFNKMNRYGQAWVKQSKQQIAKRDSDVIDLSGETKLLENEFVKYAGKIPGISTKKTFENTSRINIQNTLSYNEAAIEFINFKYHDGKTITDSTLYYALLVRKNDVYPKAIFLFEEKQLQALLNVADEADSTCTKRLYSLKSPQRDSLYNLVFKRLERYLQKKKTLYVSPSGILNNIAFDAIVGRGRWTMSRWFDIYYTSSSAALTNLAGLYTKDLKELNHLKIIGDKIQIIKSKEQALLSSYALNGGDLLFQSKKNILGLKNGTYTMDDLKTMDLSGIELIVLSVKQKGVCGDSIKAAHNWRKAFKKAGAGYLLYSLWEVPDRLRREFMGAFYKNWYSGMEIRRAFKETQKQIRAKYAKSAEAKHIWAAFVLMR